MASIDKKVQEVNDILRSDTLAGFVSNKYTEWRGSRQGWEDDMKELRNYIFQTDTSQTSNKTLPWKNRTSIPKICQIRDNLHANYMAALFPHDNWFRWEASDKQAATKDTASKIEAYMVQKIRESNFKQVISDALYDYVDYGNSFAEVSYIDEVHKGDGTSTKVYSGPVVHRISPYDIYFDITASSFKDAAKITRSVVSLGSLALSAEQNPAFSWAADLVANRQTVALALNSYGDSDLQKSDGTIIDGFSSIGAYYSSDMVELLEYEGDTFNIETGEVQTNRRIIVADRRKVVLDEPIKSWLGRSSKEHVGWRKRPDNLMAMGPLDNLVGMQYRLDHLENLKADVFDQIAHPVVYQRGNVEEWSWGPGERIFGDEDSDVQVLRPDATALSAEFQIDKLMEKMEELAGAPRQAMGIRTPGEKTAFEVQTLENAAGRIFQQKILNFEERFVEPLLNQMLEQARRNIGASETVKVLGDDFAVSEFMQITKEDLNQKGKLYPIGARHFSKQAQVVQNLNGFVSSAAYSDPGVQSHTSGLKIAKLYEEALGLDRFELVEEGIRIAETQTLQSMQTQAQEDVATEILDRGAAPDRL